MKILKVLLPILLISMVGGSLFAEAESEVIATNGWTAAFVKMAGGEPDQLAPSDMTHPPEYELKPSDVMKIRSANLLVFAGYEVLMKTVFESFDTSDDKLLQIVTSYAPDVLEKSVLAIAERLGTSVEAGLQVDSYRVLINKSKEQLKEAGLYGKKVIVNFHQKPLAESLGFEVIGVFGPQPLEAKKISELGKLNPDLLIDNIHNEMAGPLKEIFHVPAAVLVNFPGYPGVDAEVDSLPAVVAFNVTQLLESMHSFPDKL